MSKHHVNEPGAGLTIEVHLNDETCTVSYGSLTWVMPLAIERHQSKYMPADMNDTRAYLKHIGRKLKTKQITLNQYLALLPKGRLGVTVAFLN